MLDKLKVVYVEKKKRDKLCDQEKRKYSHAFSHTRAHSIQGARKGKRIDPSKHLEFWFKSRSHQSTQCTVTMITLYTVQVYMSEKLAKTRRQINRREREREKDTHKVKE